MIFTVLEAILKLIGLAEMAIKWREARDAKQTAQEVANEPITKKELVEHYRDK